MKARVLALLILLGTGGCASSPPARFYLLSAVAPSRTASRSGSGSLIVDRVRIPDYLDRPALVRRTGQNRLDVSDIERWGGSLSAMIRDVLSEDLAERLPGISMAAANSRAQARSVSVRIYDFAAWPAAGEVKLDVEWAILDPATGAVSAQRRETITVNVSRDQTAAQVNGMSRALGVLADHIAAAL